MEWKKSQVGDKTAIAKNHFKEPKIPKQKAIDYVSSKMHAVQLNYFYQNDML